MMTIRVSGSQTRPARMCSKICSGSRNSRKGYPASRVSPNRLLDHPLILIPFRRRRTAFDGLGDRRQCEHPLGEQRPSGEASLASSGLIWAHAQVFAYNGWIYLLGFLMESHKLQNQTQTLWNNNNTTEYWSSSFLPQFVCYITIL